jgi:two-component system, OmpR family, sensor histidine kinase TorS
MALSGLLVVVGLASFGVNRFLAQTQQRVLSASIAMIERTERVAQDADYTASLARQLAGARDMWQVAHLSEALERRIDRIATDLEATRLFLGSGAGQPLTESVRAVAGQIARTMRLLINAEADLVQERGALLAARTQLASLIATEADLARLRVTARIWELYSLPEGADPRTGLDRLADENFFTYERLAEMADAVGMLGRLAEQIVAARTMAEVDALTSDYREALGLVRDRVQFLLSERSQKVAAAAIGQLSRALGEDGLSVRRFEVISAQAELDALSMQVDLELGLLIEVAQKGRTETRERMQEGVASAASLATMLSAVLVLVTLLALLVGYMVWTRTRRRVVLRLEDVAERIVTVADGDPGQPMPISGPDEIGRLEAALNILRDRTMEAASLRERLEAAVIERTAEVVAEMRSANAARADAEEQSRAKTHFLARMSHEIRTPLNGLIGLLDLVAADEPDFTRRARLEVALTSARDLQALTEDILTFSVGQEAQSATRPVVFDPAALVHGLVAHLQVIATDKGLHAESETDAPLPAALLGEPAKIRQIMMNLLSNAVKYTERGQVTLVVNVRPAGPGLCEFSLAVGDTGLGMTAEEMRHAFDVYSRSRSARQSGAKGVGLGLAIVRQLTDAMGAELRVASEPGRGSRFTLVLRLPVAEAKDIEVSRSVPVQGLGARVLVVDDHPVNRLVARGYLERMGCTVTEADSGKSALTAAKDGEFDAILVDLGLPDIGGETVVRHLAHKGARLGILTADLLQDDAETRQRFGVDQILTKPISHRALAGFMAGSDKKAKHPNLRQPGSSTEAVLRDDIAELGVAQTSEIVTALLADMAAAVPRLNTASDPDARRKMAHRLKGAAANFRLDTFCALMQRLQEDDLSALTDLDRVAAAAQCDLLKAASDAGLPVQVQPGTTKQ